MSNRPFDPHEVLHDNYLTRYTAFDTQAFLEQIGSPLAHQLISGVPASSILDAVAAGASLDVRVLLVKLEVEQSLVTVPATPERLNSAMGYGLTDAGPRWEFQDFVIQVTLAARALSGYLREEHPFTVVGQVGISMNVRDGLVIPTTLATAALYRETSRIGRSACQEPSRPSVYQFFMTWCRLFATDPRDWSSSASRAPAGQLIITLVTDGERVSVWVDDQEQSFAPLEVKVLDALGSSSGQLVDRDELTAAIAVTPNHLYGLIRKVREKIGPDHLEQIGSRSRSGRGGSGYRLRNVTVLRMGQGLASSKSASILLRTCKGFC